VVLDRVNAITRNGEATARVGLRVAVDRVVGGRDAAGGVAGSEGHRDVTGVPAVGPRRADQAEAGVRGDAVDVERGRLGGVGVAGPVHVAEGDDVAAVTADGEGAAIGQGGAAVEGVVGGGDSAGGVGSGQGDAQRGTREPAGIARRARQVIGRVRGDAVDLE